MGASSETGDAVELWVNGAHIIERGAAPTTTLLNYLRHALGLTGTKEGCAEGDCGACTVAVLEEADGSPRFRAVNSCLILLPMMHGRRVWTVEGLAQGGKLHPVQEALVAELGSQCGYCTPGVVMSMFEACYRQDLKEPWQIDDQMCGNLCRCTGYRPIRDATRATAGARPNGAFLSVLSARPSPPPPALDYAAEGERFLSPTTKTELLSALTAHPGARIVAGGTDLSLEVTKRFLPQPLLVSVDRVPELVGIRASGGVVRIGAATRLSDLEDWANSERPAWARMLRFFGSRQIKHRATVGGNIANASPIGDLLPLLLAEGATIIAESAAGTREISADHFFTAYRKTALTQGELISAIQIPAQIPKEVLTTAYKVSKRQELDISAVSAAFWVRLDEDRRTTEVRLAYGGMAATPKRATRAEALLVGQAWSAERVQAAAEALVQDFQPLSDHRGSEEYRRKVARNLLLGFFLETARGEALRHPHRPTGTLSPEARR